MDYALKTVRQRQLKDEVTPNDTGNVESSYKKTNLTILFVTHDIEEALRLGTKVLVMDKGTIHQYASPKELLSHPATDFVRKLTEQQRRTCHLDEDKLCDCIYSGVHF